MTDTKPPACYREPTNGVRFIREAHRPDCGESDCRGCKPCPERHCTARKNCTWHVAAGEQTCGRCLSAVRLDLRWIGALAPLMLTAALTDGIESEAANLAGPAADPEAWTWRKVAAKQGRAWHVSLIEEDDEHHPERVVGTWARMVAEDYGHDMPFAASLTWCVDYLDRTLHRIAHDDEQDFPLMRRELRKCRQHLEAVLHNDDRPDRGAPCPECAADRRAEAEAAEREGRKVEKKPMPRLARVYAHWCDDPGCERMHYDDDAEDVWRCPRNRAHEWTHEQYDRWIEERRVTA